MRKWVSALLLLSFLLLPTPARGQQAISLGSLEVALWPEYDRPEMLVIYHVTLTSQTSLPVELAFRIPAAAGEPNAVASRQADGALINLDYTLQPSGEWITVALTATSPELQLEYYDPALQRDDNNIRHYAYTWPGDYAVESMTLQVQQPQGASNMTTSPRLGPGTLGSDGLTYYTVEIGAVPAGQNVEISLDYQKADDRLTIESLQVQPSAPIPDDSAGSVSLTTILPWALGILGVALVVGGIVWYWQTGKGRSAPIRHRRRSPASPGRSQAAPSADEAAIYCHECGKRASPGDSFCRACGSRLRMD